METNTATLTIPKLGGTQEFAFRDKSDNKDRYVCSTWEGDGLDNGANYDIFMDRENQEYYCCRG